MCLGHPGAARRGDRAGACERGGLGRATRGLDRARPGGAQVGDWVLVHVGFALHTIDEEEAARTLALLEEIEW